LLAATDNLPVVGHKSAVMIGICTALAIGMFVAGVVSLKRLKRIDQPTDAERVDPFYTSVALLFSTTPRSHEFRAIQRRTIWLFCGSLLLLFLARVAMIQTAGP
jgi:hypothetical protein